jgi:sensor domain CHASE-containing protein
MAFSNHLRHGWAVHPSVAAACLALTIGLAASYRIGSLRNRERAAEARAAVTATLDHVRADLSRELFSAVNLPLGLYGLVAIRGTIDAAEFENLASTLVERNPLIRNIALAPGNVVRYVFPLQGNEAALGLDYMRTPSQRESVLRAIAERRTIVAGPVELAQGGTGVVRRTPIFLRRADGRESVCWGMAATVIDFRRLVQAARLDRSDLRLSLRGRDGTGAQGGRRCDPGARACHARRAAARRFVADRCRAASAAVSTWRVLSRHHRSSRYSSISGGIRGVVMGIPDSIP